MTPLPRPAARTAADAAGLAQLDSNGWAITHLEAPGGGPPVTHTTGISERFDAAELIVFGLPEMSATALFEACAGHLALGGLLLGGRSYNSFLEGLSLHFLDVDPDHPDVRNVYMAWTFWVYGGAAVPIQQIVWPDAENRFPWVDGFDARLEPLQPLLGESMASS